MRHGPTLTVVMWDPARGTTALREQAGPPVASTRLPMTVEDGAEDGLLQVHVWAGDLGLGLPGDRPEEWAALGVGLGSVVREVGPAVALSAPEWSVSSLTQPDLVELQPGLACGWARTDGMDDEQLVAFTTLHERGVVHPQWDGFAWAATGAAALDGISDGTVERVSRAVQRALFGDRS